MTFQLSIVRQVLLLNEADVIPTERPTSDMERDSLVAGTSKYQSHSSPYLWPPKSRLAFLQLIKHYDGTLTLSSDRVGRLNEAVRSRVRVALHYDDLIQLSRRRTWPDSLDTLVENGEAVDLSKISERIDEMAGHETGGHAIRTVLTTAWELALY